MNKFWIAGRFLVITLFVSGLVASLGWKPATWSVWDFADSAIVQDADDATEDKPLCKDWQQPDIVLFVTGRQHGYIEPCGCITLARQKGGLMRRHRVMKEIQGRGWNVVPIDAGNQVRRFGQQPVIKLAKTWEGLCRVMNYQSVGLGPDDLKLPSTDLAQTMVNAMTDGNPFTCANVEVLDESLTNKFVVIEQDGKRIGVTMVIGDEHVEELKKKDGLNVVSAKQGLDAVVPKLQAAKCDFNVLMAFSEMERCRELAKSYPQFNLLVTAGGAGDPLLEPEMVPGPNHATPLIQVGVKGMYVGLVGIYWQDNAQPKIKYERVALEHRFKDTQEMRDLFLAYQNRLKSLWIAGALTDIEPREHPSGHTFVGSDTCADCHEDEYSIWLDGVDGDGGPHPVAMASLERNPNDDRVWVQRQYDPECMSCHATGWNPQNFYPYKSGLVDIAKQAHLAGNGCENCHGPGSAHVALERQASRGKVDQALLTKLREELDVTVAEARDNACKECHDLDNSPDFLAEGGFDEYWPEIEHGDGDDE